jgi:hypothetical protein
MDQAMHVANKKSQVTNYVPHIIRHASHVTHHTSHVTWHLALCMLARRATFADASTARASQRTQANFEQEKHHTSQVTSECRTHVICKRLQQANLLPRAPHLPWPASRPRLKTSQNCNKQQNIETRGMAVKSNRLRVSNLESLWYLL